MTWVQRLTLFATRTGLILNIKPMVMHISAPLPSQTKFFYPSMKATKFMLRHYSPSLFRHFLARRRLVVSDGVFPGSLLGFSSSILHRHKSTEKRTLQVTVTVDWSIKWVERKALVMDLPDPFLRWLEYVGAWLVG